jgi:hypothetical protein
MLRLPDSAGYGADTISGYRLKQNSPAINSGMVIPGSPSKDIEMNPVPMYNIPDRGAFEYSGPYGIGQLPSDAEIHVFPNPAKDFFYIELANAPKLPVTVGLYTLNGAFVCEQSFSMEEAGRRIMVPLKNPGLKPGCLILKLNFGKKYTCESLLLIGK